METVEHVKVFIVSWKVHHVKYEQKFVSREKAYDFYSVIKTAIRTLRLNEYPADVDASIHETSVDKAYVLGNPSPFRYEEGD